jgi:predicted glutamine amidotransferase
MCIAILKPDGEKIKKDRLSTCFTNNDDGAGYMFAKDGTLHFFKGFFKFNEFWKSYVKNVVKNGNPMAAIHFRIKTHGKTNVDNCHPFKINENLGFIHNGIINMVKTDPKRSDTSMFNDLVLKKLPENFIRNSAITSLIEESIGTSKLVFLDSKGQYLISNESLGKWDNNVWYSNTTYKWCFTYYNQPVYGYSLGSDSYKKSKKNQKKDISGYLVPKAIRTTCRMCEALLYTRFEQNQGYCGGCDTTGYAG